MSVLCILYLYRDRKTLAFRCITSNNMLPLQMIRSSYRKPPLQLAHIQVTKITSLPCLRNSLRNCLQAASLNLSLHNLLQHLILQLLSQRTGRKIGTDTPTTAWLCYSLFCLGQPIRIKLWRTNQDVPKTVSGHHEKDLQLL